MRQEDSFHFDNLSCIVFFFKSPHPTLWPTLFTVQIWIIMCIWRDPGSCDLLKCLLSFINTLSKSNFDTVFGYMMKRLAPVLDGFRGLCICSMIFSFLFFFFLSLYTFFFNYKMEQRMTATLGLDRDPFTWRTTPIMNDFYSSEYSYISLIPVCVKWQPANCFVWLQSLHLHFLLCLFKLWTCHFHLDPPPHLSVCIFFHCNFPLSVL